MKKNINKIKSDFVINSKDKPYQIKNMALDKAYRFYTVLNFKPETVENINKYGYHYMDNETRKFLSELNTKFKDLGLFEHIGLTKADQINKNHIWIVVEFKWLNTTKIIKRLILTTFLSLISILILTLILI